MAWSLHCRSPLLKPSALAPRNGVLPATRTSWLLAPKTPLTQFGARAPHVAPRHTSPIRLLRRVSGTARGAERALAFEMLQLTRRHTGVRIAHGTLRCVLLLV